MKVYLTRFHRDATAIIGSLYAGDLRVYTLEPVGEEISEGVFALETTVSPRAEKEDLWSPYPPYLPLIHVPSRVGIRIHAGNRARHSDGCPLVGMEYVLADGGEGCAIYSSRKALTAVMEVLGLGRHTLLVEGR